MRPLLRDDSGMVLVLTLMVLALITAVVVEFAYGVYVNTGFLDNWRTSERLSRSARSGAVLASKFITDNIRKMSYTYPGSVDMPLGDVLGEGFEVGMRVEDETAKFNLNAVVYSTDELHENAYHAFRRLLAALSIDEGLADRVADWIDKDAVPRLADSEDGAKNAPLFSVDELLQMPGMEKEVYDKLLPYVTVFGIREILKVNINGAEVPVLMSLHEGMSRDMAERIAARREFKPFESAGEIVQVPGFEGGLGIALTGRITVKGEMFRILSVASSGDGVKRAIECVIDAGGVVRYWRES
jgi:general secretion pathway protein K